MTTSDTNKPDQERVMELMADALFAIQKQAEFFEQDGIAQDLQKLTLSQINIISTQALAEYRKMKNDILD